MAPNKTLTLKDKPEATTEPAEIIEPPDGVIARRVKHTETALIFDDETTFDEWREAYAFYDHLHERGKWWLGDAVRFAEGKFPDRYTQAIEITGLSYSRLTTIVSVCGRIDPNRRRAEASFAFHEAIAYIPYQTGDHLLDQAIKMKWTRDELVDAVARSQGEPTRAEKKLAKGTGTAARIAASGKSPQLADSEKALIWNGHPLSTANRLVYQGPELLSVQEADQAAHHFKMPHAEALVNWLEVNGFQRKEGDEPCAAPASATTTTKTEVAPLTEAPSSAQPTSNPEAAPMPVPSLPVAPSSLPEPPKAAQTPLELAEAAILAWNALIPQVDWQALSDLTKRKWLNKHLRDTDELNDRLAAMINPDSKKA